MGRGTYDLTNANNYTGGTIVRAGTLLVDNTNGSATGTGQVRVVFRCPRWLRQVAGPVIVGSDTSGNGSFLTPGPNFNHPGTLTLLDRLTFRSDGFFNVGLGSERYVRSGDRKWS